MHRGTGTLSETFHTLRYDLACQMGLPQWLGSASLDGQEGNKPPTLNPASGQHLREDFLWQSS